MSCVAVNITDLELCDGEHSEAGFSSENFFAKRNQILTFPKLLSDPSLTSGELTAAGTLIGSSYSTMTDEEKRGTLASSITFKTGMKFAKFPANPDSGTLNFSLVKPGSTSKKNTYGFEIENTFLNSQILDRITYGILVFQNNEGQTFVLGSLAHPCRLEKIEGKNNRTGEGERMISLEFYCPKPPRAYHGTIQLTPAV